MKPFIVHSMGKCASSSIYRTLLAGRYTAYHCHYLMPTMEMRDREVIVKIGKYNKDVFVISPIRHPVWRNVSAYFHNYHQPGERVTASCFLKGYPHDVPLTWLDREIKPFWGIDVYAEPFDKKRGWQVYGKKLLVIRLKDLDNAWGEAFHALTGVKAPPLVRTKMNKEEEYRRFLSEETLPDSYTSVLYNSKFYRHFYK